MPDFSTSIDIEPWEYVDDCSKSEIKELINILISEGHLNDDALKVNESNDVTYNNDDEFDENLQRLYGKRHLLSIEEENIINKIASRFV